MRNRTILHRGCASERTKVASELEGKLTHRHYPHLLIVWGRLSQTPSRLRKPAEMCCAVWLQGSNLAWPIRSKGKDEVLIDIMQWPCYVPSTLGEGASDLFPAQVSDSRDRSNGLETSFEPVCR